VLCCVVLTSCVVLRCLVLHGRVQNTPLSGRRLSDVSVPGDISQGLLDQLQERIHNNSKGQTAPNLIFQAVKAAVALPFDAGKEVEMEIFKELSGGFQAKALQYQFFAERKVSLPPADADVKNIPSIQAVSVIGKITSNYIIALDCLSVCGCKVSV
jgi:hypothetical protein